MYFTTLLFVTPQGTPQEVKNTAFWCKANSFRAVRIQKSDFITRTEQISLSVHFRGSFAPLGFKFFDIQVIFIQIGMAGSCECPTIFNLKYKTFKMAVIWLKF